MKAVGASLYAKNRMGLPRLWRLPAGIDCQHIQTELDCVVDGCWGTLGAGPALFYLIQRYNLGTEQEERTSIFLFGKTTGLNPMTKPHHQLDAEMMDIGPCQNEAKKAMETLRSFDVSPTLRLISNRQTSLTLCCKPAVTLAMGTGLLVHRVQELFTNVGLHCIPGHLFSGNINLLTR